MFFISNQSTINNISNQQSPLLSLSYSTGTAQTCLDAIVKDSDLQRARERIKDNLDAGKNIKEQLSKAKGLKSGVVFKCSTTRLGQTVFEACKENALKKKQIEKQKKNKMKQEYEQMVQKANEVFAKKSNIELMTIRELTTICKPLKLKSDGKMPNKKRQLMDAYIVWKNRPPPVFEEDSSPLSYDNIDDDTDDVDEVVEIINDGGKNNEPVLLIADV